MSIENDQISLVAPYRLNPLAADIAQSLKPLPFANGNSEFTEYDRELAPSHVSVPVLSSANLASLLRTNNAKVNARTESKVTGNYNGLAENTKKVCPDTTMLDTAETQLHSGEGEITTSTTENYVPLRKLLPSNLQEQVSTVIIRGFPAVKRAAIERILHILSQNTPFVWSTIDHELPEHRFVFVRCGTLNAVRVFVDNVRATFVPQLWPTLQLFVDPEVDKLVLDEANVATPLVECVIIARNAQNQEAPALLNSGTEDLDAAMSYYSSYKVDEAELVDVPNDMKSSIVKAIVDFRFKVLKMEKERRKGEIAKERQQAKLKLKRLFREIQTNDDMEDAVVEDNDEILCPDDFEHLNDDEYEELMIKRAREQLEAEYQRQCLNMLKLEELQRKTLEFRLNEVKNYEASLLENKHRFIEQFRNFVDYEVSLMTGGVSAKVSLHYNDHAEYFKIRTRERTAEELDDKIDEEAEVHERAEASVDIKLTPTIPQTTTANSQVAGHMTLSVSTLSSDRLAQIKDKISALVEEYLGLKENSLIDFIYDHLLSHDLTKQDVLIKELAETLDEDAVVVVEEIDRFIASLT
jgi:hypothetical protein